MIDLLFADEFPEATPTRARRWHFTVSAYPLECTTGRGIVTSG
jgi:hypothetical protein